MKAKLQNGYVIEIECSAEEFKTLYPPTNDPYSHLNWREQYSAQKADEEMQRDIVEKSMKPEIVETVKRGWGGARPGAGKRRNRKGEHYTPADDEAIRAAYAAVPQGYKMNAKAHQRLAKRLGRDPKSMTMHAILLGVTKTGRTTATTPKKTVRKKNHAWTENDDTHLKGVYNYHEGKPPRRVITATAHHLGRTRAAIITRAYAHGYAKKVETEEEPTRSDKGRPHKKWTLEELQALRTVIETTPRKGLTAALRTFAARMGRSYGSVREQMYEKRMSKGRIASSIIYDAPAPPANEKQGER